MVRAATRTVVRAESLGLKPCSGLGDTVIPDRLSRPLNSELAVC
jgi:hypothetical protein